MTAPSTPPTPDAEGDEVVSAAEGVVTTALTARARRSNTIATVILCVIASIICVILIGLIGYILYNGVGHLSWSFLTSIPQSFKAGGGIGPEIFNSLYLLVLTLLISVPIGLGASIYLCEYAPDNRMTAGIRTAIEVLSSLPSIVVGLFGMLLFVIQLGWGFSVISGALTLTVFNLPILVRVIEQALASVPSTQREAGLALGLTHWETMLHVTIPAALPGIVTSVILSAGRVFGEAAALIYTAGQSAPALDWSNWNLLSLSCPLNVMRPAETLAVHIWKISSEGIVPDGHAVANGTAALLIIVILAFNLLMRSLGAHLSKRLTAGGTTGREG